MSSTDADMSESKLPAVENTENAQVNEGKNLFKCQWHGCEVGELDVVQLRSHIDQSHISVQPFSGDQVWKTDSAAPSTDPSVKTIQDDQLEPIQSTTTKDNAPATFVCLWDQCESFGKGWDSLLALEHHFELQHTADFSDNDDDDDYNYGCYSPGRYSPDHYSPDSSPYSDRFSLALRGCPSPLGPTECEFYQDGYFESD